MISIYDESVKIRRLLEASIKNDLLVVPDSFPINACKHVSILFCYHLEQLGFKVPAICVFGSSKKRVGDVGHWWVQIEEKIIDLTADQFNLIDDAELSYKIRANRQFKPVYCCPIKEAPHHKVFVPVEKDEFIYNLNELGEDYVDELEITYERLMAKSKIT